jgi:DNA-binding transcriptional MerR regulator
MEKSPDAFRTISEVAEWLGVPAHVLRFWESKFTQVKPVKRAGGRRYYRPADMALLGGIKTLLHDDGMTIKGVQKLLREKGTGHVAGFSPALDSVAPAQPRADEEDIEDAFLIEAEAEPESAHGENVVPFQSREESEPPAPAAPKPVAKKPVQPGLPSFLTQAPGARAGATPRVVDAPDPPADDTIAAGAGPLALVGHLRSLDSDTMRALAPLLGRMAVLRDRMSGARG